MLGIGIPVNLETNVTKMHKELFEQPDYILPDSVKQISNQIINRTGYQENP